MNPKHNVVLLMGDQRYASRYDARRAAAMRVRRHRERRKENKLVLPSALVLTKRVVPWLLRARLLEPSFEFRDVEDFTREDLDQISRALERHIEQTMDIYDKLVEAGQ